MVEAVRGKRMKVKREVEPVLNVLKSYFWGCGLCLKGK